MRILLMILVFAVTAFHAQAQIKGVVTDYNDKTALVGASIYWLNAKTGTTTNENGIFEIALPPRWPDLLVVSYIGYQNDTIRNLQDGQQLVVKMRTNGTLKEAVVVEEKAAMSYSMIDPLNKQLITQKELKKAHAVILAKALKPMQP